MWLGCSRYRLLSHTEANWQTLTSLPVGISTVGQFCCWLCIGGLGWGLRMEWCLSDDSLLGGCNCSKSGVPARKANCSCHQSETVRDPIWHSIWLVIPMVEQIWFSMPFAKRLYELVLLYRVYVYPVSPSDRTYFCLRTKLMAKLLMMMKGVGCKPVSFDKWIVALQLLAIFGLQQDLECFQDESGLATFWVFLNNANCRSIQENIEDEMVEQLL